MTRVKCDDRYKQFPDGSEIDQHQLILIRKSLIDKQGIDVDVGENVGSVVTNSEA